MKHFSWIVAIVLVLLAGSTALAGWPQAAPVTVYSYYPAAPAYVYPQTVAVPVMPAPALAPAVVVYPAPVAVVRAKAYYHGRPVRNTIRVVGW